jgi:hypothetical protein
MHPLESELTPIAILPVQFHPGFAGARLQPEKRLQIAVLADAVLTFHRTAGIDRTRPRRLHAEVAEWFASDGTDGPFAFVAICQSLALDPGYVRRGLEEFRAQVAAGTSQRRVLRRDNGGTRHQVVLPRLRQVA